MDLAQRSCDVQLLLTNQRLSFESRLVVQRRNRPNEDAPVRQQSCCHFDKNVTRGSLHLATILNILRQHGSTNPLVFCPKTMRKGAFASHGNNWKRSTGKGETLAMNSGHTDRMKVRCKAICRALYPTLVCQFEISPYLIAGLSAAVRNRMEISLLR